MTLWNSADLSVSSVLLSVPARWCSGKGPLWEGAVICEECANDWGREKCVKLSPSVKNRFSKRFLPPPSQREALAEQRSVFFIMFFLCGLHNFFVGSAVFHMPGSDYRGLGIYHFPGDRGFLFFLFHSSFSFFLYFFRQPLSHSGKDF